jgi:hypothetical protein
VVAILWPPLVAWPLAALALWMGVALLVRAARIPAAVAAPAIERPRPGITGSATP